MVLEDDSSDEIELELVVLYTCASKAPKEKEAQNVGATNIYFNKTAREGP